MSSEADDKRSIGSIRVTRTGLPAADAWSIAIAVFAVAVFLFAYAYETKAHLGVGAGIFLIFVILYVPLTYVGLRATSLHGAVRYVFCLTAAPMYAVLFLVSMIGLFDTFPALERHLVQSLAAGGRWAGVMQGILSGLLSAIVFWLWYRLFKLLDGAIYRREPVGATRDRQPRAPTDEASPAMERER